MFLREQGTMFHNLVTGKSDLKDPKKDVEPLGDEAFEKIQKAMDTRGGEVVAVKIIRAESTIEMVQEIHLLKSCHSPCIVNFCGAYIKDNMLWMAMEYCAWGPVSDLMKEEQRVNIEFMSLEQQKKQQQPPHQQRSSICHQYWNENRN